MAIMHILVCLNVFAGWTKFSSKMLQIQSSKLIFVIKASDFHMRFKLDIIGFQSTALHTMAAIVHVYLCSCQII